MKRHIILSALLLTVSLQASAKISLALNGGMLYNTPPFATKNELYGDKKGKTAAVIGAKFTVSVPQFQFGVGVRYGKTGFSYEVPYANGTGLISDYTSGGRFIVPYVFANFRVALPKSYLYFGLNAGYIKYGDRENIHTLRLIPPPNVNTSYELGESTKGMLSAGLQAGYTFNITDHFGLQVEAGANYTQVETYFPLTNSNGFPLSSDKMKTAYLQIPVTAGIVYSF